jgi:hypothetical protein
MVVFSISLLNARSAIAFIWTAQRQRLELPAETTLTEFCQTMRRRIAHRTDVNDIFVMFLRAGIRRRYDQSVSVTLVDPNARCKNAAVILSTAHHLDGPV